MNDCVWVKVKEDAGGGASAKTEYGDGSIRYDWRNCGEDIEVGVG